MIDVIALTLSFAFFALVTRAELEGKDDRLLGSLLAIIGLLVVAMAFESHEVILANWPLPLAYFG